MGYRRNFRTFAIRYAGEHPLAGFEASIRAMSLGDTLGLQERGYELRQQPPGSPDYRKAMDELFAMFVAQIETWNVEDESGAVIVPSILAMYTEFEGSLGQDIILDWIDIANGKVSDPKEPTPSGSGLPSPEVAIPMVAG